MKKHFYILILLCLLGILPNAVQAQITLADWNFDYSYSSATSNDTVYYTPTSTALSADPNVTISGSKFFVCPNSAIGSTSNYKLTTSTTYSQFKTGYNNYMFRIMYAGPNSITDFTTASNHKHYYQFSFPTTGYDDVTLNFSFAGGQNSTADYLEAVYSTDGGTTWVDAGSYNSASGWWTYNTYAVSISARNKANVIVRLIGCTTSTSGTANFNLDDFNVTGTEYSGGTTVNSQDTITWAFGLGTEGQVATYSGSSADYYSQDYVAIGSSLAYKDYNTTYSITYTRFQPSVQLSAADATGLLSFNVRPKTGLSFTPTTVSFDCMRFGTDGGKIDVIWKSSDGTTYTLASGVVPARNNSGAGTHVSYDLSSLGVTASSGEFSLELFIYSLGTSKQVGVANVIVSGTTTGTIADVTTYTLATNVSPSGAGSITTSPVGNEFDSGTEITLTAKRNFGYTFSHWANDAGETVSTDNPYTFTLSANTSVTAVYTAINTYSLTMNVEGGAASYMLSASPSGTTVDNSLMYEEGTTVTVTASSNPILTFTNWATGETSSDISVTMNQNQSVTAAYSAADYIVGWDFYKSGSSGRVADFYSTSDNETASLILRTADGTTTSWLDKSISAASGYYSVGAAVNWKAIADKYYYQISFVATDFTDIKVAAAMLYNYNAYEIQSCEYSLDGTTFTQLGTYDMTAAGTWFDGSFTLPSDANHAAKVYIRWIPDYTSTVVGTTTTNDGTSISAIYVTGTSSVYNDGVAPVLSSSVPAEGATGASATGKIVLTFDEKVQIADGATASLGDKTLSPTVSGKTITFPYTSLSYSTEYTFTLPANTVSDLGGNAIASAITIHFTTMSRPTVTKKAFDFVVGVDGDFSAALAAAKTASAAGNRYYIFFPNGEYNIGSLTGDSNQMTTISIANVSYIGENTDSVIIYNKSISESINSTATMYFTSTSSGIYMQDLTLMNKMDYRNYVSGTLTLVGRGVALWDQGTKNIYKNVALCSNQDTYYTGGARTYWENGTIHGTVDFICGGGDIFFNQVNLYLENRTSGDVVCAPATSTNWGYVFSNCTIDGGDNQKGTYGLGRPWSNAPRAVYINTTMNIIPTASAWGDPMNVSPKLFAEYNSVTSSGTAVDLSSRRTTYIKNSDTTIINPVLTAEEAATYTIENVLGGSDAWQPTLYTEQAAAPVIAGSNGVISWDDSNYVLCWAISKNGKFVGFTTSNSYTIPSGTANGTVYTVRAANSMGGLGEASNEYVVTGAAVSTDATLSALTVSTGTLSPTFSADVTSYTLTATNGTTSVTVSATATSSAATVTGTGSIDVSSGSGTATIVVKAEDGTTTKTYTVAITVAKSTDATLSALTVSTGTLSPIFSTSTTSYTVTAPVGTTSVTVAATATSSKATVTGTGAINVSSGSGTATIVVTAEDGTTTKTYTVAITVAKSTVATLSALTVSVGTLSPAFSSDVTSYTVNTPTGTTSMTITATATNSKATVSGAGTITFASDGKTASIVVTAEDGTTTKTYTVTVTVGVGVHDLSVAGMKLYPNPAKDNVTVTGMKTNATYTIFNAQGKRVATGVAESSQTQLNLSGYKSGMYLMQIEQDGQVYTTRFVKQ